MHSCTPSMAMYLRYPYKKSKFVQYIGTLVLQNQNKESVINVNNAKYENILFLCHYA